MLLHRLERERRVQQVGAVHQRGLLEPLARVVVPVGEAVDHQAGAHRVGEPERLDREPLAAYLVPLAAVDHRADPGQDRLEGPWPVLLGAEEEPDQVSVGVSHGTEHNRHQQNLGRWWAICRCHHGQSCAESWPHSSSSHGICLLCSRCARCRADGSDPVGSTSQAPCPTVSSRKTRLAQPVQVVAVEVLDVVGRVVEVRRVAALAPGVPLVRVVAAGLADRHREQVGPLEREVERVEGAEAAPGRHDVAGPR